MQSTFKDFQEGIYVCSVRLILAAPDYQEMNGQVEVTWQTLRTIAQLIMVHARFSYIHIHFTFIYTTRHIFPVIPIKHMIN